MEEKSKAALIWISNILKKYNIPYQITGGLAAIAYGAIRSLEDIDIEIPNEEINTILSEVKPYIVFGPARYKDTMWDIILTNIKI